jgi:hypothetical protein
MHELAPEGEHLAIRSPLKKFHGKVFLSLPWKIRLRELPRELLSDVEPNLGAGKPDSQARRKRNARAPALCRIFKIAAHASLRRRTTKA